MSGHCLPCAKGTQATPLPNSPGVLQQRIIFPAWEACCSILHTHKSTFVKEHQRIVGSVLDTVPCFHFIASREMLLAMDGSLTLSKFRRSEDIQTSPHLLCLNVRALRVAVDLRASSLPTDPVKRSSKFIEVCAVGTKSLNFVKVVEMVIMSSLKVIFHSFSQAVLTVNFPRLSNEPLIISSRVDRTVAIFPLSMKWKLSQQRDNTSPVGVWISFLPSEHHCCWLADAAAVSKLLRQWT